MADAQQLATPLIEAQAGARHVRMSPQKARLVIDLIRGQKVNDALQTLRFTPKRAAKPEGVQGCQIWAHVGDTPPLDASGYAFIALDTRTPYTHEHAAEDAGKTVSYLLRWQNAKGEPGPWSSVAAAKIPL